MRRSSILLFSAIGLSIGAIAAPSTAQMAPESSSRDLYENLDVLGVLDCEINGDIRLAIAEKQALGCEYRPRGLPDVVKGYSLTVRALQEGVFARDDDFLCWTVLYLKDAEGPYAPGEAIAGDYSAALPSVADAYSLKEGTLTGGSRRSFALEPRCTRERMGRNVAEMVKAAELSG